MARNPTSTSTRSSKRPLPEPDPFYEVDLPVDGSPPTASGRSPLDRPSSSARLARPGRSRASAPTGPIRTSSPYEGNGEQDPGWALQDGHRTVLIDEEELAVVEGDLTVDVDQFQLWQQAQQVRQTVQETRRLTEEGGFGEVALNGYGAVSSALVGIVADGKLLRWSPGTVLSYCVLQNTFPRTEWYEQTVENMRLATRAWEDTCGVEFEYRADLDASAGTRPAGVLFPVRHISAGGAFIASAFFPNDPPSRRRVLIDPSYFTTTFDRVGVLRHELGHVLGFRHEHIRSGAPAVCPNEDLTGTIDLTAYDPRSVMHYFCGGVGSRNLEISEIDRSGAQLLYGAPLSTFELQDA